jgi:hypothetical protein
VKVVDLFYVCIISVHLLVLSVLRVYLGRIVVRTV